MDFGIRGRVAVVTGGDSGMGLETARLLAAEGVRVVLTDRTDTELREAAQTVSPECIPVTAELHHPADVARVFETATRSFGGALDILVHAAGITGPQGDFLGVDDNGWRDAIETDLMNAVRVTRAAIPLMRAGRWGRIVLFCSEDAVQPYPDELPYCAAKAATLALSKGLSKAYAADGILVNAVSPAFIRTPMTDAMMDKRAKKNGTSVAEAVNSFLSEERPSLVLKRRGEAPEVAAIAAMLCSAHASFVTGANFRVDGGSVATI